MGLLKRKGTQDDRSGFVMHYVENHMQYLAKHLPRIRFCSKHEDLGDAEAFSNGAAVSSNANSDTSTNQICNPPFVHALAVPEGILERGDNEVVAVARGDGAIEIIDLEYETHMGVSKNKKSLPASKCSQAKLAKNVNVKASFTTEETGKQMRIKLHVGLGGHTAAASCVAFSKFGEAGKFLISGSNDASIKVWNWTRNIEAIETCSRDEGPLSCTINNKRKVNWLCTTSHSSENLIVCDTSRVIKAYSIQ